MPTLNSKSKSLLVLDTYALLAVLYQESSYSIVVDYLKKAAQGKTKLFFNEINLGELYYRVWKNQNREAADQALVQVSQLPLISVPVDRAFILAAAEWKGQYAISYADAFVVQTAILRHCPILTADPEFDAVREVEIIRLTE